MDPADFASLLEREPQEPEESDLDMAMRLLSAAEKAVNSAQERIKSLEDVLVAIRTGLITIKNYAPGEFDDCTRRRNAALDRVLDLIGETLDPCESWCVAQQPHEGICMSAEDFGDGE